MSFETFEKLEEEKKEAILSSGIKEFAGKTYKDASTDSITRVCGISKGILFHYFGSKKEFYFYCLNKAMERLMSKTEEVEVSDDFYTILFSAMERKMELCVKYHDEMHLVNMASRDASGEIADRKTELLSKYMLQGQIESAETLRKALQTLDFKDVGNIQTTVEGLHIYTNAILNKYLLQYQQTPDVFFAEKERMKAEMKTYLDLILFGICK